LSRYRISNDTVYVIFKNVGSGLKIRDEETALSGFVLSAANKVFKTAAATLLNDSTIAVTSAEIPAPVAVRYAWARNPICNLYNSENIPATPFRSDMWNLSSYSLPQTSCTAPDSNANLASIYINGKVLEGFSSEQLVYNVNVENSGNAADVIAVPDNPFSTVTVARNGNKITIAVTAENSAVKTYELNLSGITAVKKNALNGIEISRNNNTIIIQNAENKDYRMKIFNQAGQCIVSGILKKNSKKQYNLQQGIYLFQLSDSAGSTETVKYLTH
jgi:hypothetical protein